MDSDRALRLLGKYSWWQLRSYFIYAFGFGVPYAWMRMSVVFIGDTPNYRCDIPDDAFVNETIPELCDTEGDCEQDKCHMYRNLTIDNTTVGCENGYWYDPESGYQSTLVTDFDLVCGKNWLVELSMTLNQIGSVLGAVIFPQLSDAFGRKRVFLGCLWSNFIIAFIQAFSVNMWMYTILGFVDGFQQQGMISAAIILIIELFPTEQRTFAGVAVEFFWAFGFVSLIPFAYFIRNWRYLQIAITAPLVFTLSFYWFQEESIPWLVANKKLEKAEAILKKAAKFNNIPYPDHVFTQETHQLAQVTSHPQGAEHSEQEMQPIGGIVGILDKLQQATTKDDTIQTSKVKAPLYTIKDVFRYRIILMYSLIQWFTWLVTSLGYNAMSLMVTYLPGDRYLNTLLYSLTEIPAYIVLWIMFHFIGRRNSLAIFFVTGGLALLGTILQIFSWGSDMNWLIVILSVIGKMAFSCCIGGLYVFTPELYPTNMRSTGLGLCQVFNRIGSFTAPFFRVLARSSPAMPSVIIGSVSLVAGVIVLVLPETRHEPLPDSVDEIRHFKRALK